MLQEYPVVIMQCRGLDDPTLPVDQQLSPETCWTSSRIQRSQSMDESQAVWRKDAARHGRRPRREERPGPAAARVQRPADLLHPHRPRSARANGTVYASCTAETMAPEAAVGAAFPPAEMAAFTDAEGNG